MRGREGIGGGGGEEDGKIEVCSFRRDQVYVPLPLGTVRAAISNVHIYVCALRDDKIKSGLSRDAKQIDGHRYCVQNVSR